MKMKTWCAILVGLMTVIPLSGSGHAEEPPKKVIIRIHAWTDDPLSQQNENSRIAMHAVIQALEEQTGVELEFKSFCWTDLWANPDQFGIVLDQPEPPDIILLNHVAGKAARDFVEKNSHRFVRFSDVLDRYAPALWDRTICGRHDRDLLDDPRLEEWFRRSLYTGKESDVGSCYWIVRQDLVEHLSPPPELSVADFPEIAKQGKAVYQMPYPILSQDNEAESFFEYFLPFERLNAPFIPGSYGIFMNTAMIFDESIEPRVITLFDWGFNVLNNAIEKQVEMVKQGLIGCDQAADFHTQQINTEWLFTPNVFQNDGKTDIRKIADARPQAKFKLISLYPGMFSDNNSGYLLVLNKNDWQTAEVLRFLNLCAEEEACNLLRYGVNGVHSRYGRGKEYIVVPGAGYPVGRFTHPLPFLALSPDPWKLDAALPESFRTAFLEMAATPPSPVNDPLKEIEIDLEGEEDRINAYLGAYYALYRQILRGKSFADRQAAWEDFRSAAEDDFRCLQLKLQTQIDRHVADN